jgi:single-strand DNA-binding protein
MYSLNKVSILGTVGKDPEVRTFPNGGKVANFSVATSEEWKDKATGEKKKRTEWHRISVLNPGIVGVVENYVKKGSKVYIEGQLETREWEKDGIKRQTTEITIRPYKGEFILLPDGKKQQPESHKGMVDGDVPNNNVMETYDIPF